MRPDRWTSWRNLTRGPQRATIFPRLSSGVVNGRSPTHHGGDTSMRRFRVVGAVLTAAAAAVLFAASPAQAAGLRSTDLIAFVRGGNLFVATGTAAPVQITSGGGYEWPRWAATNNPGGIAYIHNGDLFVAHYTARSGLTGTVRVTTGADAGAASWAPDGHRLAFVDNNIGLLQIADVGTAPVAITTLPTG